MTAADVAFGFYDVRSVYVYGEGPTHGARVKLVQNAPVLFLSPGKT